MRRILIVVATGTALALAGLAWNVSQSTSDDAPSLTPQTADAGGVEVTVTPLRVARDGALFDVAFDTHTVDLNLEPDSSAALVVGGSTWGPAGRAIPRAGHHRSGRLSFGGRGPAAGGVRLAIADLPTPVTFEWDLTQP